MESRDDCCIDSHLLPGSFHFHTAVRIHDHLYGPVLTKNQDVPSTYVGAFLERAYMENTQQLDLRILRHLVPSLCRDASLRA